LIEKGILVPGDELTNADPIDPITAFVSDDFGILIDGVRHESPGIAASVVTGNSSTDGWVYWQLSREGAKKETLRVLLDRGATLAETSSR
jgi:hypothetical protein